MYVFQPELEQLLNVLALCHTVRVDRKDNAATGEYSSTGMEYDYQASSPDEKALVETARKYEIFIFILNIYLCIYSDE